MDGCRNAPFRVWNDGRVVRLIRVEGKVSRIIRVILRDGIWKSAAWIVVSVKHIPDPGSGLRPSQTCPDHLESRGCFVSATDSHGKTPKTHSGNVRIFNPLFEVDLADRIYDDDGVLMNTRHRFDEVVTVGPSGQVLTISSLQRQYGHSPIADLA